MTNEELEELAEQANIMGDKNLAVTLFTFLGARQGHMDDAFAVHVANWARKRAKEMKQFQNKKNN